MNIKQIYISPSNQHNNMYADGKTTEKQNCELIAAYVKENLYGYDVEVNCDAKSYNSGGYGRCTTRGNRAGFSTNADTAAGGWNRKSKKYIFV